MKTVFTSPWTPERIRDFRKIYNLSQKTLASLLNTTQQRVSEWEMGMYQMKRPYSFIFTDLELTLSRYKAGTRCYTSFAALMREKYGVKLEAPND